MGDFNAHSILWGMILQTLKEEPLKTSVITICVYLTISQKHLHSATGAKTSLDLTLSSPDTLMNIRARYWVIN